MINSVNQNPDITNVHGDHIASCLCCLCLRGELGSEDLSDVTPGDDFNIYCAVHEFNYSTGDDVFDLLRDMHNRARHCKAFDPRSLVGDGQIPAFPSSDDELQE